MSDLILEAEIISYCSGVMWRTKCGSFVPVVNLSDKYIDNCLFYLEGRSGNDAFINPWYIYFRHVLNERQQSE